MIHLVYSYNRIGLMLKLTTQNISHPRVQSLGGVNKRLQMVQQLNKMQLSEIHTATNDHKLVMSSDTLFYAGNAFGNSRM